MSPADSHPDLVDAIAALGGPLFRLGSDARAVVSPVGARLLGLYVGADEPNLLWTNPDVPVDKLAAPTWADVPGGLGGDRLWFAPEDDFHGPDEPTDGRVYEVPPAVDPGGYEGRVEHDGVVLTSSFRLDGRDGVVGFDVTRRFRLTPAPPAPEGLAAIGVEARQTLRLHDDLTMGRVGLWCLLQVPAGSVVIVPTAPGAPAEAATPLSYGRAAATIVGDEQVLFPITGHASTKIGIGTAALTGRTAALRRLADSAWCLLVREFAVHPGRIYADHPPAQPRTDQAFQAWDGWGFGEMEYHSPALLGGSGPRTLEDVNRLWAFVGGLRAILDVGRDRLGVDLSDAAALVRALG
jgi:hypothetical protein